MRLQVVYADTETLSVPRNDDDEDDNDDEDNDDGGMISNFVVSEVPTYPTDRPR